MRIPILSSGTLVRGRLFRAAIAATVALGLLALFGLGIYRASQAVPDFYEQAVAIAPARQEAAGYELERTVLELHNELQRRGKWEAVIDIQQINGWLAVDLPKKFPDLLPPSVRDPRAAIQGNQFLLACRYNGSGLSTVVSLTLEVKMADEPNTISVRVRKARAGLVPLPLKQLLDHIATTARHAGLALRWAQVDGDPVAMITIPEPHDVHDQHRATLETLDVRDGKIWIAGSTGNVKRNADSSQPVVLSPQTAADHSGENRAVQR